MTFRARDELRYLGASEGHYKDSTCSVINSLPYIDRLKKVISDNLL